LVYEFLDKNYEVVFVGNGSSLEFLKTNFPSIKSYDLGGLEIKIAANNRGQSLSIATQIPKFIHAKNIEHDKLLEITEIEKPQLIISDNRYGIYHPEIKSVLITHQLKPRFPILKGLFQSQLEKWMRNFDEIWVPDNDEISLSDRLSNSPKHLKEKVKKIGFLSHFSFHKNDLQKDFEGFNLLLSGPDPQRTKLHELVLSHPYFSEKNMNILGNTKSLSKNEKHKEFGVVKAETLIPILSSGAIVICRSGYSSIMDLGYLGCKCIFIPTPGQPEQIYLAKYLSKKNNQVFVSQKSLTKKRLDIFQNIEPLKIDRNLYFEFQNFIKPA